MMEKRGRSGGFITINSFKEKDSKTAINQRLSMASSSAIKIAAKEGLLSLYADASDVLDKYKDFDIAKSMRTHSGKLLWVRARAIDADVANANGDYFSEAELLGEVTDQQGNKIPAYKTFEGVPIYTNHKNDDIELAKGMVVHAEWDDKEKCVYCVFIIDEEAYPEIARGIRVGYMHDVSMGCQVESGTCSECGNKATTEREYCDCLKKHKGKTHPKSGKRVYEKNHGIKFIELSVVGDGAFDSCMIEEIYDVEDILHKAASLDKKADSVRGTIIIASSATPNDLMVRRAYEECLRTAYDTTKQTIRIAQSAGTLVGGQLLAGEGAGNNTTVANILKFLGIEGTAGLNILDMLNLALNFLEVAVMNLFARKDNVDLAHVGKITKSMADLQSTMQDMIDDGIETGGSGQQPMNQGQMQPQQAPQAGPNAAQDDYSQAGAVGRSLGPQTGEISGGQQQPPQTQNHAFTGMPMGFGGGIFANSKLPKVVWAHNEDEEVGKKTITASVKNDTQTTQTSPNSTYDNKSLTKLADCIMNLADTLGVSAPSVNPSPAVVSQPLPSIQKNNTQTGGTKAMEFFKQFKNARAKREAAVMEQEVKVHDKAGHTLRLSADGTIQASYEGQIVKEFDPILTDEYKAAIEAEDGPRVAAALLAEFQKFTKTANWKPEHNYDETRETALDAVRTGTDDDVKENLLGNKAGQYNRTNEEQDVKERELNKKNLRPGTDDDVKENMLDKAGLYSRQYSDIDVRENLIADARRGHPEDVIEQQLEQVRNTYGPGDTGLVTTATINALSKAVIASRATPEEIVETTQGLVERNDFAELIHLASLGNKTRRANDKRAEFWKTASQDISSEVAVLDSLGEIVSSEITAADVSECLHVVASEVSKAQQSITRAVKAQLGDGTVEPSMMRKTVSKTDKYRASLATLTEVEPEQPIKEHLKTALFAFANASDELVAHPNEIITILAEVSEEELLNDMELARSAAMRESRLTVRARRDFWGATRFASNEDVYENVVGWLADCAEAGNYNSGSIVSAAKKLISQPVAAENLIKKLISANTKTAAIQVTDERTSTKRLECTVDDIGLDPKDEGFESAFRDKAIEIMASNGYTVDPSTFTFTDLNINGDTVSASVTSTVRKTFSADSPVGTESINADITSEIPAEVPVETPALPEPSVVMSESIKNIRIAKRQEILEKYAQAAPGMGAAPAPAGAGAATDLGSAADSLGISSFTAPTAENPIGEEENVDDMSEPGTKQPWGTICPQCGSSDVDVANGEGNCNACGANIVYEFSAKVKPNNEENKTENAEEEAPLDDMPDLGGDMGLGAATAPAPGGTPAPGAAPGPGGTAPMMMAASWKPNPETFIRVAQLGKNLDRKAESVLPAGFICPSCGNREINKIASTGRSYCYECGTVSVSNTTEKNGELVSTISWLI